MKLSQNRQVLLFLLVGCCAVGLASGKKNLLSQLGNMMTDSQGEVPTIDYDAATGTVVNAQKIDASCDGQLAAALVRAKELASTTRKELDEELAKHKSALETLVELQKDLAQTNTKLVEERGVVIELKDTINESLQVEKNRSKEELEALKNQAQNNLEALRGEKDDIIASLKEGSALALESTTESADMKFQGLKTEKDEIISSLEAKLKMSSEELEATMRMELEKAKEDKETKVAAITADRDATVAELTESTEKAKRDAAEILQKTQEDAAAKLAAVEADRDTQLATLTQTMGDAAKEAVELLESTNGEAKLFLSEQLETTKRQAEIAAAAYQEQLSMGKKNMQNFQEYTNKMMEEKADVEQSLEDINAEITHWRILYSQRSYCNMTHIASDVYDVSAVAYRKASGAAVVAVTNGLESSNRFLSDKLDDSNRFIVDKFDEHWPTVSPYYEEHVSGNYQKHIVGNFQTHLEPPLQKHVFPKLRQASSWSNEVAKPLVLDAIEDGKTAINAQVAPVVERHYQEAANMFGNYCKSSLQEFQKASQELEVLKDHPPPAFLLESWETSCANPRDSIIALMQGTIVFLFVIFYRRLFGLAFSIVAFSVTLVVRFTPLRFVVPRRSTTKTIESPPSSPSTSPPSMKKASTDSLMKVMKADEDDEKDSDANGTVAAGLH